ncbi:MbtH family protein [Nocardia sp. NPDC051321]|uniref:MbtH family protein n=1 Tax=Nocardia sp. NPDC051321 TaxID=3364323 RepID=UPI0037A6EDBB
MNETRYLVVVNHEEQYSIWETTRPIPAGWRAIGFAGTEDECLDHIDSIWTDMRPLSVRERMESA